MSDQERGEAEHEESGVFGKLPSARPGVRSPRRKAEGQKGRPAQTAKASESAPGQVGEEAPRNAAGPGDPETASSRVRPPDTTGHSSPSPSPTQPETARGPKAPRDGEQAGGQEAPHAEGPGVEDLAWAGITVAAEAATLGVRLLSRALEAVRGPADRR
jgi:hypothetical protein